MRSGHKCPGNFAAVTFWFIYRLLNNHLSLHLVDFILDTLAPTFWSFGNLDLSNPTELGGLVIYIEGLGPYWDVKVGPRADRSKWSDITHNINRRK